MADVVIEAGNVATGNESLGDGRQIVFVSPLVGYVFFIDSAGSDFQYRKTTDGGASWGVAVTIDANAAARFTVWFDRWTPGDSGVVIHTWFMAGTVLRYRSLDTSSDTLGTARTLGTGSGAVAGSSTLSASKARGGNLYVAAWFDFVTTDVTGFFRSVDGGTNWAARTTVFEAVHDLVLLFPGGAADNQDMICIFWDLSADELSRKLYDDSGNAWAETSISTGMVETSVANVHPQMSGAVRHSDNAVLLAAWNAYDNVTSDLLTWTITESAITPGTNVITDRDDTACVALSIDQNNNDVWVFVLGQAAETFLATVTVRRFRSQDDMATWDAETAYSEDAADDFRSVSCDLGGLNYRLYAVWFDDDDNDLFGGFTNSIAIEEPAGGVTTEIDAVLRKTTAALNAGQSQLTTIDTDLRKVTAALNGVMQPNATVQALLRKVTASLAASAGYPTTTTPVLRPVAASLNVNQSQLVTVAPVLRKTSTSLSVVMQPDATLAAVLVKVMAVLEAEQAVPPVSMTIASTLVKLAGSLAANQSYPLNVVTVLAKSKASLNAVMQPKMTINTDLVKLAASLAAAQSYPLTIDTDLRKPTSSLNVNQIYTALIASMLRRSTAGLNANQAQTVLLVSTLVALTASLNASQPYSVTLTPTLAKLTARLSLLYIEFEPFQPHGNIGRGMIHDTQRSIVGRLHEIKRIT